MKYLVLLIGFGEMSSWTELTPEQQAADMQRFHDFGTACEARPGVEILSGEALGGPESFTVMTTRGGAVSLTEGPFAEALEGLGGFYLLEVPDIEVLVELLTILPPYDIQIAPAVDTS